MTRLKYVLAESGLKQRHVAKLIGIDETYLSLIVTGDRPLLPDLRRRLAKALRVSQAAITGDL
jgi:transcriptional regulator with XRE-family HTH domain